MTRTHRMRQCCDPSDEFMRRRARIASLLILLSSLASITSACAHDTHPADETILDSTLPHESYRVVVASRARGSVRIVVREPCGGSSEVLTSTERFRPHGRPSCAYSCFPTLFDPPPPEGDIFSDFSVPAAQWRTLQTLVSGSGFWSGERLDPFSGDDERLGPTPFVLIEGTRAQESRATHAYDPRPSPLLAVVDAVLEISGLPTLELEEKQVIGIKELERRVRSGEPLPFESIERSSLPLSRHLVSHPPSVVRRGLPVGQHGDRSKGLTVRQQRLRSRRWR